MAVKVDRESYCRPVCVCVCVCHLPRPLQSPRLLLAQSGAGEGEYEEEEEEEDIEYETRPRKPSEYEQPALSPKSPSPQGKSRIFAKFPEYKNQPGITGQTGQTGQTTSTYELPDMVSWPYVFVLCGVNPPNVLLM